MYLQLMNPDRDEEIAASVGAHRDLGPAYDDAIAAGLVERIGAEVDRRVDERISRYQHDDRAAAGTDPAAGPQAPQPAVHPGGRLSWQQAALAFGSMIVGLIASVSINTADADPWPIITIWIAVIVINVAIFRAGGRLSWQQVALALGSMIVGLITSVSINTPNGSPWPVIIIWIAVVVINIAILRSGRPSRRDHRSGH